jgi:antitoxin component YwqK of YwqJK toxin-antitoxin module
MIRSVVVSTFWVCALMGCQNNRKPIMPVEYTRISGFSDSINMETVYLINRGKADSVYVEKYTNGKIKEVTRYSIYWDSSYKVRYYENGNTCFVYYPMNWDTTILSERLPVSLDDTSALAAYEEDAVLGKYMDSFHDNGRLAAKKIFLKAANTGTWSFYDRNGSLIDTVTYP